VLISFSFSFFFLMAVAVEDISLLYIIVNCYTAVFLQQLLVWWTFLMF
jgi:hypothetical protein